MRADTPAVEHLIHFNNTGAALMRDASRYSTEAEIDGLIDALTRLPCVGLTEDDRACVPVA